MADTLRKDLLSLLGKELTFQVHQSPDSRLSGDWIKFMLEPGKTTKHVIEKESQKIEFSGVIKSCEAQRVTIEVTDISVTHLNNRLTLDELMEVNSIYHALS